MNTPTEQGKRNTRIADETQIRTNVVCGQRAYWVPEDVAKEIFDLRDAKRELLVACQKALEFIECGIDEHGIDDLLKAAISKGQP